jgi:excisionase family DNA binding protein
MENFHQATVQNFFTSPLLTAAEVGHILHLSRSHTYSLMKAGLIPVVRIGKSRRVRSEDLEAFIKNNIYSAYEFSK